MELSEIIGLISNTGFPIVAFIFMYKMCVERIDKITESLNLLNNSIIVLNSKLKDGD